MMLEFLTDLLLLDELRGLLRIIHDQDEFLDLIYILWIDGEQSLDEFFMLLL